MAVKVLIDTNILLDVLMDRLGFADEAANIWKLCECRQLDGHVYALSIANLVYILRKELPREKIVEVIQRLECIFTFEDMLGADMRKAAISEIKDYEDALQSVCAERIKADYIVTRNIKDFSKSRIIAVKPSELVERTAE